MLRGFEGDDCYYIHVVPICFFLFPTLLCHILNPQNKARHTLLQRKCDAHQECRGVDSLDVLDHEYPMEMS